MSFPGVVVRALGWLARSPAIWLYGLLAALLGWANLPVAILAAATRSAAFPLGGVPARRRVRCGRAGGAVSARRLERSGCHSRAVPGGAPV